MWERVWGVCGACVRRVWGVCWGLGWGVCGVCCARVCVWCVWGCGRGVRGEKVSLAPLYNPDTLVNPDTCLGAFYNLHTTYKVQSEPATFAISNILMFPKIKTLETYIGHEVFENLPIQSLAILPQMLDMTTVFHDLQVLANMLKC